MISYLKNKIKSWNYKHRFPQAHIDLTAHISFDSTLGIGTVIGASSSISKSKIGDHVVIYSNNSLHEAEIGRFSFFASGSQVSMAKYGSFCSIGPYLICGHGDHPTDFVSTSPVFYSTGKQCGVSFSQEDLFEERKEILVGHDVWIGARVFIRDGVKIGNGAIIAAGSVVVKDVPDYAIVGGVPARIIRYRFTEKNILQLLELEWWHWEESKLRQAQALIASNNVTALKDWKINRNNV
jgi:acetyltransferase-like isoleucine patch superfamily enzyme